MNTELTKIRKDDFDNEESVTMPLVDIYEDENQFVLKADMPGVKKENIDISLHDDKLEISGKINHNNEREETLKYREHRLYNYYRSFTVGNNIDSGKISANVENGVLTLTLPKKEEVKPRKIEIQVA